MSEITHPFAEEINTNARSEMVPTQATEINNGVSFLNIRHRGCFILNGELTSKHSGEKVAVLYADPDVSVAKLTASHVMSPVGPTESIGGKHGFPRWADYHEFAQNDGPNGEKRVAFQAMRSDNGLGLTKVFELTDGTALSSDTIIYNSEADPIRTSLGEHYYFALANENSNGLTVNGKTLDELLGKNAENSVMNGKPLFWQSFNGEAEISFPAGHNIRLSAEFTGDIPSEMGMLVWHRPGSPSICFEPTVGFGTSGQNDGIELPSFTSAVLSSKIELL